MPAPAVYVLAVVGTVSAVLAFKEFVYEPHIAPAIDRWYIEYQAARMRRQRQAAVVSAAPEDDVPMSQTTKDDRKTRKPKSRSGAKYSDTDTSSDDEASTSGVDGNRLTKDGLLRRPLKPRGYERLQDNPAPPVIELDDLVAREVRDGGMVLVKLHSQARH
ncbi:hypothetical protein CPB84DRAFT_1523375 [Gymnopilus junonius]|uniref:Uncharacterized protein n=1 Tax=Gymnopilus junonius TaxID=109634 RepID=A0A9P5TKG5_GYMJU|nr:hypothetical protein CPB84DRAFT_1523375 [Gymnopilus junonius]